MQIQTKGLLSELQWAKRFTDTSKGAMPILAHVLFAADGNRLTLTGTDLEVAGVTTVDGEGSGAWTVPVPVAKLIKYLEKVDEPEVTLSVNQETNVLTVTHHQAHTAITGMAHDSFPDLPAAPPPQARLGGLPKAVERVLFAISKEESRFTINGALLEADEGMARLIATDGHRLSVASLPIKGDIKIRAILPKQALSEAGNLDGDCTFATADEYAFLNWGQRRIVTRKLTGNFPDWKRVMVSEPGHHVMLPVETALKTLDRVAIYADARSRVVSFTVQGGKLTIKATSTEGSGEGSVLVAGVHGAPFTAGYNATYVSEFLSKMKADPYVAFCWQADEVIAGANKTISGASKAAVFTTADRWSYVLMPYRLQ